MQTKQAEAAHADHSSDDISRIDNRNIIDKDTDDVGRGVCRSSECVPASEGHSSVRHLCLESERKPRRPLAPSQGQHPPKRSLPGTDYTHCHETNVFAVS